MSGTGQPLKCWLGKGDCNGGWGAQRCGPCNRGYKRAYSQKLREAVITFLGGECERCAYAEDIRALEIDHIHGGGGKERKIKGTTTIYNEILTGAKGYQLLCANCHAIKTHIERRKDI